MYIKEKNISNNTIAILFLIAAILLLIFHTVPANRKLSNIKAEIAKAEKKLVQIEKEKASGVAANGLTEVDVKTLEQAIPSKMKQDELILDLSRITQKAEISFNALSFTLDQKDSLPAITVSAGFVGTPDNLMKFLKMLETSQRKIIVKSASVSRGEKVGDQQFANMTLSLQTFYQK